MTRLRLAPQDPIVGRAFFWLLWRPTLSRAQTPTQTPPQTQKILVSDSSDSQKPVDTTVLNVRIYG